MLKFAKILFVLVLLVGCAKPIDPNPKPDPEPKEEELFKKPQGNIVSSPVSIPYVYGNPIEIIEDIKERISSFTFTGLKNKVIENKINGEISKKIDLLLSYINPEKLPPFRGIYVKIPKDAIIGEYYVGAYPNFNFNNVLSVSFYGWYRFDINGTSEYVSIQDALNFDLTTGNPLTISDILTNDSNTQKIFSDQLAVIIAKSQDASDYIWDQTPVTLVAPFKGIKGNQQFFISSSGIHFIFDYRNPEFDNSFTSAVLHLPYSKIMPYLAVTQRFTSESFIYESPIRHAEFLELAEKVIRDDLEVIDYRGVEIYDSRYISSDVPAFYLSKIPDSLPDIKQTIDELIGLYEIQNAYISVYANKVGDYIGLSSQYSVYADKQYYQRWYSTYNAQGDVITLDDLFVSGYYYRNTLRDEILKIYGTSEIIDMEALLDSVQFMLNPAGISFSAYLPPMETNEPYIVDFYIPYSTFGMENLTLFDHE